MTTIKEIIRNKSIISDIYTLTFKQLIELKDIEIPDIQVDLDEDRVNGIVDSYYKYKNFFTAKSLLTVANLETSDCNKYYLVDGQHRFAAIKKIVETVPDENNPCNGSIAGKLLLHAKQKCYTCPPGTNTNTSH